MWLSVDSKIVGHKRKLKELSIEIPIKRADTLLRVESNTAIFAKRAYSSLFGVIDHGMLYIVPKEILTDNMKTVMDKTRTAHFKGIINAKFKQFADDYGFQTKPCIAGRPQTKAFLISKMYPIE